MSTAIASVVLAVLVLPLATATAVTMARRNCSGCGGTGSGDIPYPFGVGPTCSLPGFDLTCAVDEHNIPYLMLSNSNNSVGLDVYSGPGPLIFSNLLYSVKMIPGIRDYSVHWEAPAPFAISGSSNTSLFVVGCSLKASLFNGSSGVEIGNCFAVCVEAQFMEKLPVRPCVGIGCCLIDIKVNLRAFTLNISRISDSGRSGTVQAVLIRDGNYLMFQPNDVLRSNLPTPREGEFYQAGTLDWSIPYQPNCKRAMEERASYACVSNHSECQNSPIGGYACHCSRGFSGNPYVVDGCVPDQVYGSTQSKANCPTMCGNMSVPFPFGIELGCFARIHLYLTCNPGPFPTILQMTDYLVVTDISIDEGILRIQKLSNPGDFLGNRNTTLYSFSGESGMVKWAVDNPMCKEAMLNKNEYRCFSAHSDCVDVTDDRTSAHVGYRCKCSSGFEGNPYLEDGCTDINECLQPDKYSCNGICQNAMGSFTCSSCPHGTDYDRIARKCRASNVILGVSIGLSSGGG